MDQKNNEPSTYLYELDASYGRSFVLLREFKNMYLENLEYGYLLLINENGY